MWSLLASAGSGVNSHWPGILSGIAHQIAGWFGDPAADPELVNFVEASLYAWLFVIPLLCLMCFLGTRNMKRVPTGLQNFLESIVKLLDDFTAGIIDRKYAWRFSTFIGSLFIYISVANLWGLIPGQQAATSIVSTTCALALCTFVATHWAGLRYSGPGGYFKHFCGEPAWLAPLNVPIHLIGEVARPLSLMIRLRGNIGGEETAIAIFISLGILTGMFIPFQLPLMALGVFTSLVQAFIFCILSAVYIAGALPHEHHHEDHHAPHHPQGAHEELAGSAGLTAVP
jgi:F-type H+-transporting ATPase subunit a